MNTALVPVGSTLVVPSKRLYTAGFDGLDESDQAIPYIRVVQPTSTECKLMDGSDAKAGQFYDTALMKAHASRDRAILEVFLQTGLRLSELTHLCVSDLELPRRITKDPENVGFLKVRRKRGKEVLLPLNWKACEALAASLTEREQWIGRESTEQALFVSKFRKVMTTRAVRFLVEKYMDRDPRCLGSYPPAHDGYALLSQGRRLEVSPGDVGPRITGDHPDLPGARQNGTAEDSAGVSAIAVVAVLVLKARQPPPDQDVSHRFG